MCGCPTHLVLLISNTVVPESAYSLIKARLAVLQ